MHMWFKWFDFKHRNVLGEHNCDSARDDKKTAPEDKKTAFLSDTMDCLDVKGRSYTKYMHIL